MKKGGTDKLRRTPWGRALESLRDETGLSRADVSRRTGVLKDQYYRACQGKFGPSVMVIDRWLHGLGYTWTDWAAAFEDEVERDRKLTTPKRAPRR